jgi:GAG-pre-integrase domain
MHAGNEWNDVILQNVLYVPELHGNLLSVSHLTDHGADVRFAGQGCHIYDPRGNIICKGQQHQNLYLMNIHTVPLATAHIAVIESFPTEGDDLFPTYEVALTAWAPSAKADLATWHQRLGHLNTDTILCMARKGIISGIKIISGKSLTSPCESCLKGKQTCAEIQKTTESRSDTVLGHIHSDLCGKILTRSHKGYHYFATWIDDASQKVFVDGLCKKSEALGCFKVFVTRAEVQLGTHVQRLRTDGGGEYKSGKFEKYLDE